MFHSFVKAVCAFTFLMAFMAQPCFAQYENYIRNTEDEPPPGLANVLLGKGAGKNLGAGTPFPSYSNMNVVVGVHAVELATELRRNVFVGSGVASIATGFLYDNVIIGTAAANSLTTWNNEFVGNTIIGSGSGQYAKSNFNTFVGMEAGKTGGKVNSTLGMNSFLGAYAGTKSEGELNTYLGANSGMNNTGGNENLFVGFEAGKESSSPYGSAYQSVFLGAGTGYRVSGANCTFVGYHAGFGNGISTGTSNVALGSQSSAMITSGSYNTTIGTNAGRNLSTGQANVFIGLGAGFSNDLGSFNTYLGQSAGGVGWAASFLQNATAIGANALVGVSNGFVLGDTTNTKVGIGTAYPNQRLTIRGNMNFLTASNLRFDNAPFLDINPDRLALGGEKGEFPVEITSSLLYKVTTEDQWADYVFQPSFRRMPLNEVAAFIAQNGHLPGIPSAKEVVETGVSAAQMDAKLLAQIEQLTLYAIEQSKNSEEIRRLVRENEFLKRQAQTLQRQLDEISDRLKKVESKK